MTKTSDPIHIISLGAGVQSSTMALMAAHGEITPTPKCCVFADTQDEPQSVYKWLDWLEKQLPFPVHRVTAGSLSKETLRIRKGIKFEFYSRVGVPAYVLNADGAKGKLPRHCTRDFKVTPLTREQKRVAGIKRNATDQKVVVWIGISLDEVHRMKPSRESWAVHRWPLVDARMTRWKCISWMKAHDYPEPPRSACVYCPYHSDREWRRLRAEEPAEFAKAVKFERDFQAVKKATRMEAMPFLHNSCVPLDQVDFSTDEDHGQQVMFGNECEGMCGV